MEKPWVVCQGSPFLCKHWQCSRSSKARHYWGGGEAPLHKTTSKNHFFFFSDLKWRNHQEKQQSSPADPRAEPLPLRVWQRTTVNNEWFSLLPDPQLALKRQSRWKVLALLVLLPPVHFSCSRDRKAARVSCLNHGHFEATTSNCSHLTVKYWAFSLSTPQRSFSCLDFTHLYSQKYLPCFVQWLIWTQLTFFSPKTLEKLLSIQAAGISVWPYLCTYHTCNLYST